ncbi:MAG: hypothetical protein JWN43_3968, partial [Gammaproteobacteria bacterium]|nr:hypothetical protein [Gammaproteobacteria bacterium]
MAACAVSLNRGLVSTKAAISEFLVREFPQNKCVVEEVSHHSATVTHRVGVDELRPGGT